MDRVSEIQPGRPWTISLASFSGILALGAAALHANAGIAEPGEIVANLAASLSVIGVLGAVMCGAAMWAAREN